MADIPPHLLTDDKKVILITGDTGIGKTTFAYRLVEAEEAGQRFDQSVKVRPYLEEWGHLITKLGREVLGDKFHSKANTTDIEKKILDRVSERRQLVLVDDADPVQPDSLKDFIVRWAGGPHRSVLILTIRNNPFGHGDPPAGCVEYKVPGLDDGEIKRLLGDELVEVIDENGMWDDLRELGNNPQKLLFLRWHALKDALGLRECIKELRSHAGGSVSVESVIRRMPYPLVHFLALGRMRDQEFEESLLAFLWDRLGGGSTENYVRALELLLDEKLISGEKKDSHWVFRLSAGVHVGLEATLRKYIGQERVRFVDYFISEYYRNRFSAARPGSFELPLLERYVYHALESENFDGAYAYVFESDILDTAHQFGRSLELEPILKNFREAWAKLKTAQEAKGKAPEAEQAEQGCRIYIESGRVCKDLSRHKQSISFMKEAEAILGEPYAAGLDEGMKKSLQRRIWHYMAISNSQLGQIDECVRNYFAVVSDAHARGRFTAFDTLSLGYLAYELKFRDIALAEDLGRTALRLSQEIDDHDTVVKNMSSLGQTLFFLGKDHDGEIIFNDARQLCKLVVNNRVDRREEGRILINSVVFSLAANRCAVAESLLNEGLKLNQEFGDRRRAATALAYQAILLHKQRQLGAREKLLEAIGRHMEVESWRELVNEVLTYVWLTDPSFDGDVRQAEAREDLPGEVRYCLQHINGNPQLGAFVDFWVKYFKPRLLS